MTCKTMRNSQEPDIRVECYAGYRGEEEPRRFFIGQREVSIDSVLERWVEPGHRYFKVGGRDDRVYLLRQVLRDDHWEVTHLST